MSAYPVRRAPRSAMLTVRGLSMHVRRWGPEPGAGETPLLLLHGWQDSGDTFQFLVDSLVRERAIVAPDWRGFGRSEWARDSYWFPDYFADLDALLDQLCGARTACLVGHSMGGHIAMTYAGIRPERVHSLISLEGFGLPSTEPEQAPARLRRWLEEVRAVPAPKRYASFEELGRVIQNRFPRFGAQRARFVAEAWAEALADGGVQLRSDPRHRWVNPVLYERAHSKACWRKIRAQALMLIGSDSDATRALGEDGSTEALEALVPGMQLARIADAGHMLHIEQPEAVAAAIEDFLVRTRPSAALEPVRDSPRLETP